MSAINVDYNGLQPDVTKPSLTGEGLGVLAGLAFSSFAGQNLFGNSYIGNMGNSLADTFFSTLGKTAQQNISSGQNMLKGFGTDLKGSMASTGVGLASSALGSGITKAMGNSKLGRGVGAGAGTTASIYGGLAVTKALATGAASKAAGMASKAAGSINPYAAAMTIAGSALGAVGGPSKEYGGKYGNITKGMDLAYDAVMAGVNFVPGFGQIMLVNKGLSNLFGSTSGMTKADAFLGSAFTPAPIKWANMAGAKTTSTFNNLSWQNDEKTRSFMQDSFGDLLQRFDKAKQEAGKTYGTASHHAYKKAQRNINFANMAWEKVLNMADQNELQNIRSQAMSTINNQRYAQNIQGGFRPTAFGKQGMKILNNSTNHNIGQRLLSAAALIDNKQMILSALGGTKLVKWTRVRKDNDTYGYVRTNEEDRPVDFDEYSGKFKVYEQPNTNSKYTNATIASTKVSSEPTLGILRTPDDHDAHIEEQRAIDKKVNLRTLTPGRFVGLMGANVPLAAGALGATYFAPGVINTVSSIGNKIITNPWVDAGLTSLGGAHAVQSIKNGTLDAFTALELAPAMRVLKPMFKWTLNKTRVPVQKFLTSRNGITAESRPIKTVRLYRATGTNGNFEDSLDGGQEFSGLWFTNNPMKPQRYASMTVKRAKRDGVNNPIELLYVDIPEYELNNYKASEILKGRTDIEYEPTEDFLIPLDYPRQRVPLEGYTGNLLTDARRSLPELSMESRPLKITSENAASITPKQLNATFRAAYERGDKAEGQRLWDLWFRQKALTKTPGKYYRGTQVKRTSYPDRHVDKEVGEMNGIYLTKKPKYAKTYGDVEEFYLRSSNPLETEGSWTGVIDDATRAEIENAGYDAIVNNKFDTAFLNKLLRNSRDETITFDSRNIKSAEPFTFADDGSLIPLTERANFRVNDKRYSWLPWFLGGSTAATLHNTNK